MSLEERWDERPARAEGTHVQTIFRRKLEFFKSVPTALLWFFSGSISCVQKFYFPLGITVCIF